MPALQQVAMARHQPRRDCGPGRRPGMPATSAAPQVPLPTIRRQACARRCTPGQNSLMYSMPALRAAAQASTTLRTSSAVSSSGVSTSIT